MEQIQMIIRACKFNYLSMKVKKNNGVVMNNSKKVISLIGGIVLGLSSISAAIANTDISGAERLLRTRMNVKPMNLSKDTTTEDLIASGQLGGHLFPTSEEEEELTPLKTMKSKHRKKGKKNKTKRAKKMRNDFAKAIQSWNKHEYKEAYKDFKKYMEKYPNSPWAAEAHLHMGCEARYNGRYSEAESTFKEIIGKYADQEYVGSKMLADKAKSRLGVLKYLQNNQQESAEYFKDLKQNSKDWRLRTYASNWLMKLGKARKQGANELYDCGIRAMAYMLKISGKKKEAKEVRKLRPTGDKGQSIAELKSMAEKYGFDLTAININVDQIKDIPLPAIAQVDNKQSNGIGHYWIIEKIKGNILTIRDQQAPRRFQQTKEEFAKEWSGNALVFAKPDGLPGSQLSQVEIDQIYGGCCGVQAPEGSLGQPSKVGVPGSGMPGRGADPGIFGPVVSGNPFAGGPGSGAGGSGSGSGSDSESCPNGAPLWSVNPVNLNLFVGDIPLWYAPEIGPSVSIALSYNSQSAIAQNEIFGNKWAFNYASYLVVDPGQTVTIFMPDGRRDIYILDNTGNKYVNPTGVFNTLEKLSENHFLLKFPNGWIYEYAIPSGTSSLQPFLVKITDTNDLSLTFGYDANVRLSTITDATNKVSNISYYSGGIKDGLVNTVTDPFGRIASFEYDDSRNLTKLTDMGGYWTELDYDQDVYLTKLENPKGEWKFYIEPADGIYKNNNDYPPPGGITRENYRITITNPDGDKQEYFYEDFSRQTWYVSPKHYVEYKSPSANDIGANNASDAPKTVFTFHIDKISKVTTPEGVSINYDYEYDSDSGFLKRVEDELGRSTSYTYNDIGNIETITSWDNKTTTYTYDSTGQLVTNIDAPLGSVSFEYDTNRRLIKYTDINNNDISYSYNPNGQLLTVTDQLMQVTNFEYNTLHQLDSIGRGSNFLAEYTYDSKGRVHTHTDASGFILEYEYNDLNSITKITYPDGGTETFSYSMCPRLMDEAINRGQQGIEYSYDKLKRLTKTVSHGAITTGFVYDKNNMLTELIDSNQNKTKFEYDHDDRLKKKIYQDGKGSKTINYNSIGRVESTQDAKGTKTFTYYLSGNIEKISYSDMNTPDITYVYDEHHRLTQVNDASGTTVYTYNDNSTIATIDGPWDNDTVAYTYDDLGRVLTMSVEGSDTITYHYDPLNRLDHITSGTEVYDYSYMGNSGLIQSLSLPNGTTANYTHNNLNQLELLSNKKSDQAVITEYGFQYNSRDLVSTENRTGTLPFIQNSKLDTYQNNDVNQTVEKNSQPFVYDDNGNMTQGYTAEGYQFNAIYDAENQLSQLTHTDSAGVNHKKEYVFNAAKLLVRVKTYQDDVLTDDLRIVRAGFLPLQDRDGNNTITRKYVWGQNVGGGIGGLLSVQQSGNNYYYHYDGRGNITTVTDSQQQVVAQYLYDEYGQINNQSGTLDQPFRFSTKRTDTATGMIYFGYRFYVPEMQKWLTRDPIGENGGINLYGYVGGNPIGNVDPFGFAPGDSFKTQDEAAIDAIKYTWEKYPHLVEGKNLPEAGGYIYQEDCGSYTYNPPVVGKDAERMNIDDFNPVPQGKNPSGYYHTHPSGETGLSDADMMVGNSNNMSAYAGYKGKSIHAGDPTGKSWNTHMNNERTIWKK